MEMSNGIKKQLISVWKKQKIICRFSFPAENGKREIKIRQFRAETAGGIDAQDYLVKPGNDPVKFSV